MGTRYIPIQLNLSENQKIKIKQAIDNGTGVSIKINMETAGGPDVLPLTQTQLQKLKTNKTIKLSKAQLKHIQKGGFLPFLAAIPGLIASAASAAAPALATGALTGISGYAANKLAKAIAGEGLYLKKGSNIATVETDGEGLYLKQYRGKGGEFNHGNGLYLKRGGEVFAGRGLLLGQNSPFKNIPVLGWLL